MLAEGLYTDIAALALDHSVQTLKLDDSTIDYTAMYEKLANRINKDFRAYREKGKPQTKIEQLTEQIKCAFKIGETDTCKRDVYKRQIIISCPWSGFKRIYRIFAAHKINIYTAEIICQLYIFYIGIDVQYINCLLYTSRCV